MFAFNLADRTSDNNFVEFKMLVEISAESGTDCARIVEDAMQNVRSADNALACVCAFFHFSAQRYIIFFKDCVVVPFICRTFAHVNNHSFLCSQVL